MSLNFDSNRPLKIISLLANKIMLTKHRLKLLSVGIVIIFLLFIYQRLPERLNAFKIEAKNLILGLSSKENVGKSHLRQKDQMTENISSGKVKPIFNFEK